MRILLLAAALVFVPSTGLVATAIPIELEKGNPVATASINGTPVRLMIDLGGSGSLALKADAISRVSVTNKSSTKAQTDAMGNTTERKMFTVAELDLGGTVFKQMDGHEIGGYAASGPGDGAIGRDFLKKFVVIIDYPAKTITLYPSSERRAAKRACQGESIRTTPDPDGIIVSMTLSDHGSLKMLWDTGATFSFVKQSVASARNLPISDQFYLTSRFELGGRDFGPLRLVALDLKQPANVDAYIGYNFFANHIVCVDAARQMLKVRSK